jgi:hypothetical protein
MPNDAFPPSSSRAKKPFELVHTDLKALPVVSYHGYKYFVTFFDDFTSHGWIMLLKAKSETKTAIKHFVAIAKNQFETTIRCIMSDAGGEYKSLDLADFFKELGIATRTSVPHMHQQNGRAERFNRTIMDKAQAMRFDACFPQSWWEFAVLHSLHLYNRTPIRRLDWKTPYEILKKEKPDVSHFRVFGCGAYIFIPEEVRVNKLAPRSELMTFIGYADGVKGYLFMRSPNNVVFTASKALFDETMFPKCPDGQRRGITPVGNKPNDDQIPPQEDDFNPDLDQDDQFPDDDDNFHRRDPKHSDEDSDESRHNHGSDDSNVEFQNEPPKTPERRERRPVEPPAPGPARRYRQRAPSPARDPLEDTTHAPQEEQSDLQPRRSGRVRQPTSRPDNVYLLRRPKACTRVRC